MKKNNPPTTTTGPERRSIHVELRTEKREDGQKTVRGHGAVYNSLSQDLGGFREIIKPGAFDNAIGKSEIRALINHNPDKILGNTDAGTLRVTTDERGLAYEVDLPDTSYARDLSVSLERKDITKNSFAFTVERDEWTENDDGTYTRTIHEVRELFDVSMVTYPAYAAADIRQAIEARDRFAASKVNDRAQVEAEARERTITINEHLAEAG